MTRLWYQLKEPDRCGVTTVSHEDHYTSSPVPHVNGCGVCDVTPKGSGRGRRVPDTLLTAENVLPENLQ